MYALREALGAFRRTPLLAVLSVAMVTMALAVLGFFSVAAWNLHQALSRIEAEVEIVAFLDDLVTDDEARALQVRLEGEEEFRAVRLVTRDEALDAARRDLPEFEDLFVGLDLNPLPASLEIELEPGFRTPDAVARLADRLSLNPEVERVRYGKEWLDRLNRLQRIGSVATAILGIAFSVAAALIIGSATRIAIFARRGEIQIMRLVGARTGFIRAPFLMEGLLTGLAGGALAVGATWGMWSVITESVLPLEWIPWSWTAVGVAAGALFGLFASFVSVRQTLRQV
jgi:cell division transport system permease protein